MAKISLLSADSDTRPASNLAQKLILLGHSIVENIDTRIPSGELPGDWLSQRVSEADAFVVLISHWSLEQRGFLYQIKTLKQYCSANNKSLIPVLMEDSEPPDIVSDVKWLSGESLSSEDLAQEVHRALASYIIERNVEDRAHARQSATVYIQEAINNLDKRARSASWGAWIWLSAGLTVLTGSIYFVYDLSKVANSADTTLMLYLSIKSLIIISISAAASRYAFKLGIAYRSEQLKNFDRIHAIFYGKFYLEAFGEQVRWEELKEVFQHWNINNEVSSSTLGSEKSNENLGSFMSEIRALLTQLLEKK